ncbi:MAG: hypothetical protein C4576_10605 [Desulfobacteraceae bacterium]|nr:MAG: hypothetical protein C4576_10605 [Desulfobacteraceae bacterium]
MQDQMLDHGLESPLLATEWSTFRSPSRPRGDKSSGRGYREAYLATPHEDILRWVTLFHLSSSGATGLSEV